MVKNKELISVVVAVYNSGKFIQETLESIYAQSYENIELIICDDYSSDNTIEIINSWLKDIKQDRFYKINLIERKKNVGLTKNINFGVKSSHGKWIKCLGGDDILTNDCLDILLSSCINDTDIIFGKINHFYIKDNKKFFLCETSSEKLKNKFKLNKKDFFYSLIEESFLPAPAAMFSKKLWDELGGFNERYKMVEDWPFWLKAVQQKKNIKFIDKIVLLYREHEDSITAKKLTGIDDNVGNQARIDIINFSYHFRKKYIKNIFKKWEVINLYHTQKILSMRNSRIKRINYLLFRCTSPIYIKNVIQHNIEKII